MLQIMFYLLRFVVALVAAFVVVIAGWIFVAGVPKLIVASLAWLWIPAVLVGAYLVTKLHHHWLF